ncbi:triacylglycerol lipase [Malassezia psittaci]|uniref:triacylglycerol lipase n=1 Tax=Malassezia psittaci TaxID=1821823 RepID=A0AAF0FD82_9BASI|nr:triacylglycerol lipase [Malassezia psittaci]
MGVIAGVVWLVSCWQSDAYRFVPRTIRTQKQQIRRMHDVATYLASRSLVYDANHTVTPYTANSWEDVVVDAPNITDRNTLLVLAHMATQAYYPEPSAIPDAPEWHWAGGFGWEQDGLRGHLFTTDDERIVVVALKGTSASLLPGGKSGQRDKENDNLLFSCCCARVNKDWTPVCDCYKDTDQCDSTCLSRALLEKSLYYPAATDMYNNLSYTYPTSQIWITGHSLGGVLASFLGITFGVPAVAFESPGDRLAARRLHLPLPPVNWPDQDAYAMAPVTHVYNTADSLATGQCRGPYSLCSRTGYAMEAKCHVGQSIVYDTTNYLGWSVGVLPHRITQLTSELLAEDWHHRVLRAGRQPADGLGPVPIPRRESQCEDCEQWQFQ